MAVMRLVMIIMLTHEHKALSSKNWS